MIVEKQRLIDKKNEVKTEFLLAESRNLLEQSRKDILDLVNIKTELVNDNLYNIKKNLYNIFQICKTT